MNTIIYALLLTRILVDSSEVLEEVWYRGCLYSKELEQYSDSENFNDVGSIAECSLNCLNKRFPFIGVQLNDNHGHEENPQLTKVSVKKAAQIASGYRDGTQSKDAGQPVNIEAQSTVSCVCLNISSDDVDSCNQALLRHSTDGLPVGLVHTSWAIYTSEGPFLTTVTIETDDVVAIVNIPVAIEIHVARVAALNVTKDNHEVGHQLDITWTVKEEGTSFKESVSMRDFTHILHRPKYTFSQPNNYTIDVEVTNGISTLHVSHVIEVVYPAPVNLQTRISKNIDLPSCIPEEFKVTEQDGQTFEVFVDTQLQIESAVARGTNLTFTFWFEDNDEDMVRQPCENCTSVTIEHMFVETGMFKMLISVDNVYGHLEEYITFVVIPRQLSNLTLDLDPESSPIITLGQPVHFLVSLITTSRSNRSLRVWYGDHHSNMVSIADTMSPRLVLEGDGKDMEIIASYGEGCTLLVEFYYTYRTEGLFKPSVAVFEDNKIYDMSSQRFIIAEDKVDEPIDVINKQIVPSEFNMFAELYEYSRGPGRFDHVETNTDEGENLDMANAELSEELNRDILVLSKLTGARIHTSRVARCNHLIEINLLLPSMLNISVYWQIYRVVEDNKEINPTENDDEISLNDVTDNNEDLILYFDQKMHDTSLVYMFKQVGAYLITAKVKNAVSSAEASFDIFVQCPIEGLTASCSREFIPRGAELVCMASVQQGSDIVFHWYIEGIETNTYTRFENHTSVVRHIFKSSGIYDISLQAMNNVSKSYYEVESPVHVQNRINNIKVLKGLPNLLGNVTKILGIYQPKCCGLYYLNVEFDFDFGYGRENNEINHCDDRICWGKALHIFHQIGTHEVIVYAYNDVSEVSKTVQVQIYPALDNVTVEVAGDPVAGSPARFVVLQNGKTMETVDIYFSWLLREDTDVLYTNSPVVEAVFNVPGNYVVFVNLTNPVDTRHFEVSVLVRSRAEVDLELLHDLYVTPGLPVTFDLHINSETPVEACREVRISYSDGHSKVYRGFIYQWKHTFYQTGSWQINITLVSKQGTTLDTVRSVITVQEPVSGLQLTGPKVLAFQEFEFCSWVATTVKGTNILYNWTLEDSILIPNKQYEIKIPSPGNYILKVEAFNDVARQPLSTILPVLVQNVIEEVDLKIIGNLIGKATQIIVSVNGYHDFMVDINYGDGESEIIYSSDPVAMVINDTHILVYLSHVYDSQGEYNVTVEVSNQVSSLSSSEIFIPIEDIALTTRSPWVIRSTGHVVAKAVVTGGKDLTCIWNFSDDRTYEKSVTNFPNQTSIATHFYGMSGEYCVTFNVTGHNYPPPGVYAELDRCFLVVDPIDTVELVASSNSSSFEHNVSLPVTFTARLFGSHVVFVFDYGDGTTEKKPGTELSPWNKDMTMFAEGIHSYTSVGEFKVKVTAINPLGNETVWLPLSFWVQEPPKDLHFYDESNNKRTDKYIGEVGEVVTMVTQVISGDDVRFDWKLGDQTDLVNNGSVVKHKYMTPGVKTVFVTAYNKVRTLTKSVKVFINYKIQGVELVVESKVLSVKQEMMYTAIVRPDNSGIVTSYLWTFKSPTKSQGRGSYGGIKKYSSRQSAVPYTFHVPGECTATVTAKNAISNSTSATVELYVYTRISLPEILILSEKENRLVNLPITFMYYAYSGSDVNLKWNFGDNSEPVITSTPEVKHLFTSEGVYKVTVLAENPVSSLTVYKMLFVLNNSYCDEPKVKIIADTENLKIVHSRMFTLEADVTLDCNLTSAVAYHWSIDDHVTLYSVEMVNRVLVLPPRVLKYGEHTVKFEVEMLGTIVYAEATMVVEVIPSPLVSKIHGGVLRRIRYDGEIILDGSSSFDPDHLHNNVLRFDWKCSYLMENGTYGESCLLNSTQDAASNTVHNASCHVAMDTAVLSFPGDCLVKASNFTFELIVSAHDRQNGTSFQIIALEQENTQLLNVKIVRPYIMKEPVNPDRKLSFYVECTNCKGEGVKYEWTMKYLAGYNIHNYARAHDMPCVDKDGKAYSQVVENDTDSEEPVDDDVDSSFDMDSETDQAGLDINPYTIGSEIGLDMTTTVSLLSYGQIVEGKSSSENRRQRSSVKDINSIDFPKVEEQADSKRRSKSSPRNLDIVEEKIGTIGRGVPRFQAPEEGTPGESGSSGGRKYTYASVPVEEAGGKRKIIPNPLDEPDDDDDDAGSGRYLDKLEGGRRGNVRQRSILEMPMIRSYLPKEKTRTGLDGESLVIKPGYLKQGLTYFLKVKVTNEEGDHYGEAVSSFIVNESPVHGSCSVLPDTGVELDTEFRVMCKEWKDEHKPLMYEVSYTLDTDEDRKLIYRGVNGEFPIRLPAGKQQHDYNVNVYIDILDGLLAKTSVCSITIRVTPKTLTDDVVKELYSDARSIYEEVTNASGVFRKSVDRGDDAISKVSIIYLASRLNSLNDSANTLLHGDNYTAYNIDNSNATYVIEEITNEEEDLEYRKDARRKLLEVLEKLLVRDEAELLQTAQALSLVTAVPEELDTSSLYLSLEILESVCEAAEKVYQDELTPTGDLVQLVVATASSIVKGTMGLEMETDEILQDMYKQMITKAIHNVNKLILNELKFHLVFEEPLMSSSEVLSIWASRHSISDNHTLSIGDTQFKVPSNLGSSQVTKTLKPGNNRNDIIVSKSVNERCLQSHMTSFSLNPYGLEDRKKIESVVAGLNVYDCEGKLLHVVDLQPEILIHLPNKPTQAVVFENLVLNKWSMNVHQFNITIDNLHHALHFLIDFIPLKTGRLFPITILLSFSRPPSHDNYQYKYDFEAGEDIVDIFLPAGSFNATGMYYIGIVDSTYNSKRLRPGEVTQRNYTLKLWSSQCLYWNVDKEVWLPDGCSTSQTSTLEVTKCSCNHLTSFGGRFELIPNKLTLTDIEGLFSLNQNPVTLTLVSVILVVYCILLFWCYRADHYDNRKGGIVYLLDNSPMDQQKFEITVETGVWKGAGTTAKISIILHGEEGMSETRELISVDDRPMFERNSRDKFILSLPDSIGRIWKVQIWHNNLGSSPSWYLNRVIVRDLNTGNQYIFICEKWLAVEEQDGKVEREFMVHDGTLQFKKALPCKVVQYMADLHIWLSLVTCPPYSGFMRTERLTVCLTMLMAYMCLNAMWYKVTVTEYRGEFGLLDVSWRSVTVGAICCTVIIPLGLMLEFLFRRSKPKHASTSPSKDEVTDWEPDYPSGKPNELESEDSSEQVQPIMTYSLLDQSILNWPNIQSWAQKQWIKRQVTGRSTQDSHSGNSSSHSGHHHGGSNGSTNRPGGVNPVDLSVLHTNGVSELDQASSGFEDCSSLIRPKASVDSTHTTAAPSVNESTRVHKPQSLADSLRISTKLPSESDFEKTSKAPSISSTTSNKSSVLLDRKTRRLFEHMYLPYWCRYLAWTLCGIICVGCATVTILYGYRFGTLKSTLWLQSLYFSWMICIFISNPVLILIAVFYAAWVYKNDPYLSDSSGYDIFNRQKAKEDLYRWKKQLESWDDGEALERGVAARQRSRYLRFARPPQEKQLIEARKRVIKEKKALTIFRESVIFAVTVILLVIMAYSKDTRPSYFLNTAVKSMFMKSGVMKFSEITTLEDWYRWTGTTFLDAVSLYSPLHVKNKSSMQSVNSYMIGQVQLRQQRVQVTSCPDQLPYVHSGCLGDDVSMTTRTNKKLPGLGYTHGNHGDFMFGQHGVYGGSGFIIALNSSRSAAISQLKSLKAANWLDRGTRLVFIELTLYSTQSNLFTAVKLLAELSSSGKVYTTVKVTSSQLFRYVTLWDNVLLGCELLFFVLMILSVKNQTLKIIAERKAYFTCLWNNLTFLLTVTSLVYCCCYIYRFVIVADTVETLRSTYYERYVSVAFITFWDEMMRSYVAILLFLCFVKSLRLLRFNKQFAVFGEVYRKARREMVIFFAMFCIVLAAYTSLGHILFGTMVITFRDIWSSLLGVTALLTGTYHIPEFQSEGEIIAANLYTFTFCVFGVGLLTSYMVAVLSHYFKTRKRRRLLAMSGQEAILFYWYQFQLWIGLQKPIIEEEPVIILPPEFTMAEIEYQVDELLFRMNALTGSHGLPEKPPCYLTDSDCTYGGGDDGISSAGSEAGPGYIDDRLEQRVQKIEDNLCSQEPFVAQLLQFDSLCAEDLSHEREKQLRSHLELEIFRQLQIQRQDLKSPVEGNDNKGGNSGEADDKVLQITPHSPGQGSTSSDELAVKQTALKPTKPRRTRSSLKVQTIHDLIAKTTHDLVESHDNSSSNPDSPRDKSAFSKINKPVDSTKKVPIKQNSSSSSSEKISPETFTSHTNSLETETIKKPTKPTFLHSRDSSLSDGTKSSPIMKLRTSGAEKGQRLETNPLGLPESSSGSEQDSLQIGKKMFGRRSLRKTKSRGKGKGPDSLEPALILDEIEGEEAESLKMEVDLVDVLPPVEQVGSTKVVNNDKLEVIEHIVTADIHQANY